MKSALLAISLTAHTAQAQTPEVYEPVFRQVHGRYWQDTGTQWHLLSEVARAESSYRQRAVSPVGAAGLMQLMPATYRQIVTNVPGFSEDIYDARSNIRAGGYHLRNLYRFWHEKRPQEDKLKLALASYNAGAGNLLKAQKKARSAGKDGTLWPDVSDYLAQVTGSHAPGTIRYVEKIYTRYQERVEPPPTPPAPQVVIEVRLPDSTHPPPAAASQALDELAPALLSLRLMPLLAYSLLKYFTRKDRP